MRGGNTVVALASVKGSPGVTSTALALATVWPRPAVLVEADPAGGDLAYRARAAHGGVVHERRSVLTLAAAVHSGLRGPDLVPEHAQRLSCGVDLVPGFRSTSQASGFTTLWTELGWALRHAEVDVLVDLGRVHPRSALRPLVQNADVLCVVTAATFASAVHTSQNLPGLAELIDPQKPASVVPVIVGPDAAADHDCEDLDQMLRGSIDGLGRALPVPLDSATVRRLEDGERADGRLGRTLLLRRAAQLARGLTRDEAVA